MRPIATTPAHRCAFYMNELTCGTCHGYRLNDQALSVRVGGEKGPHIGEISDLSIADHLEAIEQLTLSKNEAIIARPILKEIKDRLTFLNMSVSTI